MLSEGCGDHVEKSAGGRRAGLAAEQMRRHNLGAVLDRVHHTHGLTRSELTSLTGLNRSTIADLIRELSELGLVEEGPPPHATGPGRPSPTVRARPAGAAVLAVEVAVDSVAVATIGLGGHVYNQVRVTRRRGRFSPTATVEDVAKLAGPLLDTLPVEHTFVGTGVAVVGVTRRTDGVVHVAPNLGWEGVPLGDLLAEALPRHGPVLVANEADLGALAEHRRAHPDVADLLYVSGEVGIGVGVVAGGRPLLGSAGHAGEAGHMLVNPDGRECRCGATGCWETEAGEIALLRRAGITADANRVQVLLARAAAGDEQTLAAIAGVGRWLGLGIGSLVNLFNPELVVLGGLYQQLFEHLEPALREHMSRQALATSLELARVVPSELDPPAPLLGAAELVLSRVLADPAGTPRTSAPGGTDTDHDPDDHDGGPVRAVGEPV